MLTLLLSAGAFATPTTAAHSAHLVGAAALEFDWPADTPACRADLVLGADGVVQRVEPGRCGEALRPVLDGLLGLAFERPEQAPAVLEARLVPPTGERGKSTPVFRALEVAPIEWPTRSYDDLATVPPRTACAATLTVEDGEKPSSFTLGDCPDALAKVIEKKIAGRPWSVRTAVASPDGWTAQVIFAWVEDPARSNKRLLVIEGTALPKTRVAAQYPYGETGSATCDAAVQVEKSGMPMNVTIGGCDPVWDRAARSAVQKWTFLPRIVDGEPTADDYVVTVTFSMN